MLRSMLTGACLLALLGGCATGHETQQSANASGPGCVREDARGAWVNSGPCAVSGRTWSRTDLERSGQQDVGQALQQIDPSITTHH